MTRWTRFVLGHRVAVIACWAVLALTGAATASLTTSRLDKTFTLPGRASYVTDARILATYKSGGADPVIASIRAPSGTDLTQGTAASTLSRAAAGASLGGRFRVVGYPGTGDSHFVLDGGRQSFLLVFTPPGGFDTVDPTPAIAAAVRAELPPNWTVAMTGSLPLQTSSGATRGHGVFYESLLGGVAALVVLAAVFASPLAVLPLLMAIAAIPTTFLLLLGLTTLTAMSFVVQFLIGLVGLGVAIDYSLLVTTRWREEAVRRSGDDAVVAAMATAGRAVVFSGLTVAIGLVALVILPVPFLHSMGYAGALIPLTSVAAALSLLPVCLASFGARLDRHRFRRADSASPPWTAWARLVTRHRLAGTLVGVAFLAVLIAPVFHLSIGQPVSASLTQSGPARAALVALERGGVPSGVLDPMVVLVAPPEAAPRVAARAGALGGIWAATAPASPADARAGTALVTVLPVAETGAPGGTATVSRLRDALAGTPGVLGVGGSGPETVDLNDALYGGFPLVLGLVGLVTLLVLARAFRSLVLAAKAVVFNLASLGAAYGILVVVWQDGHGSTALFGLPATGAIANWIPIVIFAFLFGLAIDYEVFILARVREVYDETGDTDLAVIEGIGRTGRLVTSAALILTFAFVAMSTAPFAFLKVLATGLAAGILVDAFIVRSLLVPALVSLFGRANWYLPRRLAALLRA